MKLVIITALLVLLSLITVTAQRKSKPEPKLLEVAQCTKVPSEKPNHTGLNCGVDEKGAARFLDIPETIYQFPAGEVFRMYVYSSGEAFPPDKQPKGSVVIRTPPCVTHQGYRIPAAQAPPCNPEL